MALRAHDDDSLLHEPRALWTVVRQEAPASEATILSGRVEVNKDHFRNGSRYPMTLTKMLVCAIGYTYRQWTDDVANLQDVHNSMVAGNLVDIAVAAPYSVHWGRRDFRMTDLPPCPSAEPGFDLDPDTPYASGAWGLCRWAFDKLLWLPKNSTLQFDLSSFWLPNGPIPGASNPGMPAAVSFDEPQTGIFGGNNRVHLNRLSSIGAAQLPSTGLPLADAFGASAPKATENTLVAWPGTTFPSRVYNRQETDRGQEQYATSAVNVLISQTTYDEEIQLAGAPFSGDPIAPLSTRVCARAKCLNGGTNEWWWRPGAPLCLVSPTIGPALVYDLPVPIVLGPGEQLELEVQVPAGVLITPVVGSSIPTLFQPTYQVGISFTGYASIEM